MGVLPKAKMTLLGMYSIDLYTFITICIGTSAYRLPAACYVHEDYISRSLLEAVQAAMSEGWH